MKSVICLRVSNIAGIYTFSVPRQDFFLAQPNYFSYYSPMFVTRSSERRLKRLKVADNQKAFRTFGIASGVFENGCLKQSDGSLIVVNTKRKFIEGQFYQLKGIISANKETGRTSIKVY